MAERRLDARPFAESEGEESLLVRGWSARSASGDVSREFRLESEGLRLTPPLEALESGMHESGIV